MATRSKTEGPTVVLVHGAVADASSWNGVITLLQAKGVPVTAPANPLRGIAADSVYVAAFAPDEGETLGAASAASKDSALNSVLVPRQYPAGNGESATEFYIDPPKARDAFAGDLADQQAALIGATQRPVAESAFSEPNGPPAWKNLRSWAVVATADKAAGTDVVRSMAERAGATVTQLDGSHVIMISQPQAVTEVILEAVAAVASAPVEA